MGKKMNTSVSSRDADIAADITQKSLAKKRVTKKETVAKTTTSTQKVKKDVISKNQKLARKKSVVTTSVKHEKISTKNLHSTTVDSASPTRYEERLKKKLLGLVKESSAQYNALNDEEEIPAHLHDLERRLQEVLLEINEKIENFTDFLNHIYQERSLSLEEKARLREVVVRLFSCVYFGPKLNQEIDPQQHGKIIDVYGLPTFSTSDCIQLAAQSSTVVEALQDFSKTCGYFTPHSSVHVLLDTPLEIKAFSDPAVLSALATMYGEVLIHPHMDPVVKTEILRSFHQIVAPYRASSTTASGCIVPCVRVWSGSYDDYKKTKEISAHWNNTNVSHRLASQALWQSFVGTTLRSSQIPKGSVLMRPPAPPLVAQAQALAWDLTQQVYQRLGDSAFSEINFVSISENTLSLRAYNHRNKIVAQSDVVHLFDVITAPDDFSLLLKEECDADGPHSMVREKSRK